jgi:hypothetical protein
MERTMQVTFKDDVKHHQNPLYVISDRKKNNDVNRGLYSQDQLEAAKEFYQLALAAFPMTRQRYLDFNKKSIVIKINEPVFSDKKSMEAFKLNQYAQELGYDIVFKQSSISYHINKK